MTRRHGISEIEIQRVRFRYAQLCARKLIGIPLILRQQLRKHAPPRVIDRGRGIDAPRHAKQSELGIRRPFEFFVREDLRTGRMIDRQQLNLIDVRDLAELLSDPDIVLPVDHRERLPGNRHVLIMIHREVRALAVARAQRRDAQHVGDELHFASVPGPDHRTGSRQPLRFLIRVSVIGSLPGLVLNQTVRPGDADGVDRRIIPDIENQRHARVPLLPVQIPGFDFDLGVLREFQTLDALQAHTNPALSAAAPA